MAWWNIKDFYEYFMIRILFRKNFRQFKVLYAQAIDLNWVKFRKIENFDEGNIDYCVARDDFEAMISLRDGEVSLIKPITDETFQDFIQLEYWIIQRNNNEEIKQCFQEVKAIRNELNTSAFAEIEPKILKLIKDKCKNEHSIKISGRSPRIAVLLIIPDAILSIIHLSEYHIVRGTLNVLGRDILKIGDYSIDQLGKIGFYRPHQVEEEKERLRAQIR